MTRTSLTYCAELLVRNCGQNASAPPLISAGYDCCNQTEKEAEGDRPLPRDLLRVSLATAIDQKLPQSQRNGYTNAAAVSWSESTLIKRATSFSLVLMSVLVPT